VNPFVDDLCRALLDRFAHWPLMVDPNGGVGLTLADGALTLLADFTHEDKEAKGLRKLADPAAVRPPIYFTALEVAIQHAAVLIMGASGSGKTSFALDLALNLAGERLGDPRFNLAGLARDVTRNDLGAHGPQTWTGPLATPIWLDAHSPCTLPDLLRQTPGAADLLDAPDRGPILIILDAADRLGDAGPDVLAVLARLATGAARVLVLGRPEPCADWVLPDAFAAFGLRPLLASQRLGLQDQRLAQPSPAPFWPARPDLFMLAMGLGAAPEPAFRLVDHWLERALPAPGDADRLAEQAFAQACQTGGGLDGPWTPSLMTTLTPFLLARQLETLSPESVAALFAQAPQTWAQPLRILASRDRAAAAVLIPLLLRANEDAGALGALVAADILSDASGEAPAWARVRPALAALIEAGRLTPHLRAAAGRRLAVQGDPRDLEALIALPGGAFTLGSAAHPNSLPAHRQAVGAFRIGRYPVTNAVYGRFVRETGRLWRSPDGAAAERSNAPATDLTWRDAEAFCAWATLAWRKAGRIAADEIVRLPTEPEWEYAARGPAPDSAEEAAGIVYPWRGAWAPDHANGAEAGFNATCTVGLYPKGRSPFGLDDMAGQVWEWTTTLWGEDMAAPSFTYPYRDDGRESGDAGPAVRRVLRGGCFSSNKLKACCTYRGSLEPDGFWRGNGFRVVVSSL
jgi:iron(II)-dependent oxidoreductase